MKTFPLKLTDEQHKYIQDKAYELRMSMHKWILLRIELKEQPTPSKECEHLFTESHSRVGELECEYCHEVRWKSKSPSKLDTNIKGSSENIEFTNKGLIKKSPSNINPTEIIPCKIPSKCNHKWKSDNLTACCTECGRIEYNSRAKSQPKKPKQKKAKCDCYAADKGVHNSDCKFK